MDEERSSEQHPDNPQSQHGPAQLEHKLPRLCLRLLSHFVLHIASSYLLVLLYQRVHDRRPHPREERCKNHQTVSMGQVRGLVQRYQSLVWFEGVFVVV